jgi:hypothetical protein
MSTTSFCKKRSNHFFEVVLCSDDGSHVGCDCESGAFSDGGVDKSVWPRTINVLRCVQYRRFQSVRVQCRSAGHGRCSIDEGVIDTSVYLRSALIVRNGELSSNKHYVSKPYFATHPTPCSSPSQSARSTPASLSS